jgi:cytochrome c556
MAKTSRNTALAVAVAIGAVAAGGALAHTHDPLPKNPTPAQRAAWARHEHFEGLGKAFKAIKDELDKPAPDKRVLAANAATVTTLAAGIPTWFPRGSGVEARPMSEAKANIWSDAAGFSAKASALQVQAAKLNHAAAAGDVAAVKAQFRPTGAACKACHDTYRQEKKM